MSMYCINMIETMEIGKCILKLPTSLLTVEETKKKKNFKLQSKLQLQR